MKTLNRIAHSGAVAFTLLAANAVFAHPGHEPEDFLHALSHELASPRGIFALLAVSAVIGVVVYVRKQKK